MFDIIFNLFIYAAIFQLSKYGSKLINNLTVKKPSNLIMSNLLLLNYQFYKVLVLDQPVFVIFLFKDSAIND